MKILLVTLYDARFGMGGAEQVVLDLAKGMRDQYLDEVACMVNPGDLAGRLRAAGIEVTEVPYAKAGTVQLGSRLMRKVHTWKPDLIHSHHRYFTFMADLFLKKKTAVLHTEQVLRYDKRFMFRYGHFAAACHESVRQNLIRYYHVPENRTQTILNSVAKPVPDLHEMEKIGKKYPARTGQLTAFCIGRMEKQKGHTYLIDAVSRLAPAVRARLRIFLAGDGTLKDALVKQAHDQGVYDSFIFLGYCDKPAEYFALSDFVIIPSLWEGSPLTLLLAYGAGKPVVASDIDGIRDLVLPDSTGQLCPPADPQALAKALQDWIENPLKIRGSAALVSEYWQKYSSLERTLANYHQLYLRLLKERRG